jgi:hypothetical protein
MPKNGALKSKQMNPSLPRRFSTSFDCRGEWTAGSEVITSEFPEENRLFTGLALHFYCALTESNILCHLLISRVEELIFIDQDESPHSSESKNETHRDDKSRYRQAHWIKSPAVEQNAMKPSRVTTCVDMEDPGVVTDWLAVLIYVREVPGSNVSP